ncbi:hypothetical protein [Pelagerythrobacter rhizovicinus]|uniref:hypothetical protein n=1 Tax=Pelagerythrobacter rhizovicinus TaxID=2268576 RepID=UPI0017852930|nr:hypothetical protein [Pelagerythrobacter rhizovicinus]
MPISTCAKALALASVLAGAPLAARDQANVRDRDPDMADIATTPLTDLNLAKDPIPEILLAAAQSPYANEGLDECGEVEGAIAQLDAVLGADLDVADEDRDDISVGRIAKSAVGSFIPFRSIVREITGAADHQREFEAAIVAGLIRRGYLKGLGQQMGCAYPARPAFAKINVTKDNQVEWPEIGLTFDNGSSAAAADVENAKAANEGTRGITFVSEEVVQPVGG